jgi:hypothetical protein
MKHIFSLCFTIAAFGLSQAQAQLFTLEVKDAPAPKIAPAEVAKPAPSEAVDMTENTAVTVVNISVATVAPQSQLPQQQPPQEPPPPPEPSAQDSSEPKRIVRYFCHAWKDGQYEKMYWAMTPEYRQSTTLEKFSALFEDDKRLNAGLADENIAPEEKQVAADTQLRVTLSYRNTRVKRREVTVRATKTPDGFRIVDSGIIPIDINNL